MLIFLIHHLRINTNITRLLTQKADLEVKIAAPLVLKVFNMFTKRGHKLKQWTKLRLHDENYASFVVSFTHTRFWRQQFPQWFMCHSLLRVLLQTGVSKLCPCFPIGRSGIFSFGFCNKFLFLVAGYQPADQLPTWGTRGCSSSGLYPSTNPAWLDLPGTALPTGRALRVIETHKLHQPKVREDNST